MMLTPYLNNFLSSNVDICILCINCIHVIIDEFLKIKQLLQKGNDLCIFDLSCLNELNGRTVSDGLIDNPNLILMCSS